MVPTPIDYHSVGEMKRCNLFSLKKSRSSIIGWQQRRGPRRVANIDGKAQARQSEANLPEEWLPIIKQIIPMYINVVFEANPPSKKSNTKTAATTTTWK